MIAVPLRTFGDKYLHQEMSILPAKKKQERLSIEHTSVSRSNGQQKMTGIFGASIDWESENTRCNVELKTNVMW